MAFTLSRVVYAHEGYSYLTYSWSLFIKAIFPEYCPTLKSLRIAIDNESIDATKQVKLLFATN